MNINKILFIFLSVVGLFVFGLWQFAHTEKFAKFLSYRLQMTFLKNFDGKVSFDSVEIGVFPLATKIKNFSLETKRKDGKNIHCKFGEVGFYFSPLDLLSSKLSIDKMIVENGFIKHEDKAYSSESQDKKLGVEKFFLYYKSTRIGQMFQMVKTIQVKNSNIFDFAEVENVKILTYKNYLVLKGDLEKADVKKIYKKTKHNYENIHIDLEVEKTGIRVKKLEMKDELEIVGFSGEVKEVGADHLIQGELHYKGRLKKAFHLLGIKFLRSDEFTGYVEGTANVSGNIKDLSFQVVCKGKRVETPYFTADNLQTNFDVVSERIIVNKAELGRKGGTAKLLDSVEILDLKNKRAIPGNARFQMNNFFTHEAFKALDFLDVLKGRINGLVGVEWNKKNVVLSPYKGLHIKDFEIIFEESTVPTLKNEKMTFYGGEFIIHLDKDGVHVDVDVGFPGSRFKGKGFVDKNGIDFLIDNSTVDFLNMGPITGVQLHGKGDFRMHVIGPFNDTWFNFSVNLNDFEVAEYRFKNISGVVKLSIEENALYLENMKSEQEGHLFEGKGKLSFRSKTLLDLDIKAERLSLAELCFSAGPVFNPIKERFKNIKAKYSGVVSVKVDFDKDRVESKGRIYTEEISFFANDYADVLQAQFYYKDKKLTFENIEVKKGDGKIRGRWEVNVETGYFKYGAKLFNLDIRDIYLYRLSNIQYKGKIFGESSGEGTLKRYQTKTILDVTKGYIGRKNVEDGRFFVDAGQNNLKIRGSFLGEIIKFESNINWGKKKSYFKGEVDAPEIKILTGLFSSKNFSNKVIEGRLKFVWNISFDMNSLKVIDAELDMKDFSFKYDQLALSLKRERNRITVKNGLIKKWDIGILGKDNFITSMGTGDLSGDFEIRQEFKLDALMALLFSSRIENAYGGLFGRHIVSWKNNKLKNDIWFESRDVFLKMQGLADSFSKVKLKISVSENKAVIENISAVLGDGTITGQGHIVLEIPFPVVDINFKMENSKISFFKKSGVLASGDVFLKGNKFPYTLDGKISVLHGNMKDEIKDMSKNFSTLKSHNKYAPQRSNNNVSRYLNYDLDVDIFGPFSVTNSLLDVRIKGGVKVGGGFDEPLLDGKIDIVKGASRVMFKNHDFIINEGNLLFNDMEGDGNTEIKLVGTVDVDNYKIKLDVSGDLESVQVELSSVPLLPQQDILSLLALGVTSGMDKDLNEKDRQSITTLSFGSLVVEQLKLHEGLTSSLGLRLSVQPELQASESSPLKGRIDKKDSSEKVKTATKVKVQKKISNNVDLSLSSTIGETAEQRQIMNIIYKVNKNLSVEGIYEINSSDTEVEESSNSGGVDIKYRISF